MALDYLISHGFKLRDRNYRRKYGEIDLVVEKEQNLHFIEVKASRYYPESSFAPELRANRRKIRKLQQVCESYLQEKRIDSVVQWQIDVISVILNPDDTPRSIEFFENAIFGKKY